MVRVLGCDVRRSTFDVLAIGAHVFNVSTQSKQGVSFVLVDDPPVFADQVPGGDDQHIVSSDQILRCFGTVTHLDARHVSTLEEGVVQGQNANPPLIWEGRLVRLRTA